MNKNQKHKSLFCSAMILAILTIMLILLSHAPAYPIACFPGAEGFGTTSRMAYAGAGNPVIYVVNTLAHNSTTPTSDTINGTTVYKGSLNACLSDTTYCSAGQGRIILFEVSGTIQVDNYLNIRKPYTMILGQSAPSPGITLRGATVFIDTHDVLMQHIRVRTGEDGGVTATQRDCLQFDNTYEDCYNIVIDHCSFSWSVDEIMCIWEGDTPPYDIYDVTLSNCIFSHALRYSIHPTYPAEHSMGPYVGREAGNTALIKNLFAHIIARTPLVGSNTSTIIVNNVIYNQGGGVIGFTGSYARGPTKSTVRGNVIVAGPTYPSSGTWDDYASKILSSVQAGSELYFDDNVCDRAPLDCYRNDTGDASIIVGTEPVTTSPLTVLDGSATQSYVLLHAGARPTDRDSIDLAVISDVEDTNGTIIDSEDDVGGWPNLAENTSEPSLPDNPHSDDDSDGYTNLEEWSHGLLTTGNTAPTVTIASPSSAQEISAGEAVTFSCTAGDADNDTLTYAWNFDGGATNSTAEDPLGVTFTQDGNYNCCVTSNDGTVDSTPDCVIVTVGGGASPLTQWARKCPLVIQASQVPGDLTNFPVLLTEETLPSEMLDADGTYSVTEDYLFTLDSGGSNRLACEAEHFTPANDPANGDAKIWVDVPDVSGSDNTTIYVWYHKPGETQPTADAAYGAEAVWNSNFKLVQHFSENPSGMAVDSTSNDSDGTPAGTTVSRVAAKVGNGWDFGGDDERVGFGDDSTFDFDGASDKFTISAWVNTDHFNDENTVFGKWNATGDNRGYLLDTSATDGKLRFLASEDGTWGDTIAVHLLADSAITANTWCHVAITVDMEGTDEFIMYLNGSPLSATHQHSKTTLAGINSNPAAVEAARLNQESNFFDGTMDELRVSDCVRSANWIAASYTNQMTPSTFVVEGSPESVTTTTTPEVIDITTDSANGYYATADSIGPFTITFSEAVDVPETMTLTCETGTTDATSTYASGSGTTALSFSAFSVVAGMATDDLSVANSIALTDGGDTVIASDDGTPADLTLPTGNTPGSLSYNKEIVIDTTAGSVSDCSATTGDGTYTETTDSVTFKLNLSESIYWEGVPPIGYVTMNCGPITGTSARANLQECNNGDDTLTFKLELVAGMRNTDLDYSAADSLTITVGSFQDSTGNDMTLTLPTIGGGNSMSDLSDIVLSVPKDWTLGTGGNYASFTAFDTATYSVPGDTFTLLGDLTDDITIDANASAAFPNTFDGGGYTVTGTFTCAKEHWNVEDTIFVGDASFSTGHQTIQRCAFRP